MPRASISRHADTDDDDDEALLRSMEDQQDDIIAELQQIQLVREERETALRHLRSKIEPLRKVIQDKRKLKIKMRKEKSTNPQGSIATDYATSNYDWSWQLKDKMKKVFNISAFRLCQESVCNASMSGKDIVCVMPTGGGKSLTYQLPALLTPGCTLVISPLIALITDQYLHLREAGVEAVMLIRGSEEDANTVYNRLLDCAKGNVSHDEEVKLCYATPEKVSKSGKFRNILQKLGDAKKLARIVIDEAHCVSQLGHDFRTDYLELGALRSYFPDVPILALSATCPPRVLEDLLKIMRMKPIDDPNGTVYFHAPLYRANLHYKVLPKPANSKTLTQMMVDEIVGKYEGQSGIVYCYTKKDAEMVAMGLREASKGRIRAGVYHAKVDDSEKANLHKDWRSGKIQVVCATIAFGLGIDKSDVRFVFHHTMSKSIDGFYQESGRAGRDGKDADCILFARAQDFINLTALVNGEKNGQDKLVEMLKFMLDMTECRKLALAKYFLDSSQLAMQSWSTSAQSALTKCGHCDNCTRPSDSFADRDVTMEAWRLIKLAEHVKTINGRVTLTGLADIARGKGKKTVDVTKIVHVGNREKCIKSEMDINISSLVEGKVELSKDEAETVIVYLIAHDYLKTTLVCTPYTNVVYIQPGVYSSRFSQLRQNQVADYKTRIICSFPTPARTMKRLKRQAEKAANKPTSSRKRKRAAADTPVEDSDAGDADDDDDDDPISNDVDGLDLDDPASAPSTLVDVEENIYDGSDEESDGGFQYNLRGSRQKPQRVRPESSTPATTLVQKSMSRSPRTPKRRRKSDAYRSDDSPSPLSPSSVRRSTRLTKPAGSIATSRTLSGSSNASRRASDVNQVGFDSDEIIDLTLD